MADSATLLSHEWLSPHGGSENVFEQISAALPGSALQCLWNDAPDRFGNDVSETWLARTPLRRSKAAALPFLSQAWATVDLEPFDRVVASSHALGHHLAFRAAQAGKNAFSYVHTPARYIWNPELDQRGQGGAARAVAAALRRQDRKHVSDGVAYAANSNFVRNRIQTAWDQDARVIYPPVAVARIQSQTDWADSLAADERRVLEGMPSSFVLGASRLIEYKRIDRAMRTGEALGLPVVIAGSGPLESQLRDLAAAASVPVHFTGRVSDELLYALYQRAELFVFMAVEDFGIMPVEAIASGTPALVNEVGGAAESVALLAGGVTVSDRASVPELKDAALRAIKLDRQVMRRNASRFDEARFRAEIRAWVGESR